MKPETKIIWLKILQALLQFLFRDIFRIIFMGLMVWAVWAMKSTWNADMPIMAEDMYELMLVLGLATYVGMSWKMESETKELKKRIDLMETKMDSILNRILISPMRVDVDRMFKDARKYRQ